jgi:nitrate/nitrite transport system ATP-binding protein
MALVEMHDVWVEFSTENSTRLVLKNVHLKIEQGEFIAIVGYSGAGKTTLMSLIAGLVRPTRGSVVVGGNPVRGPGRDRGVVFQNYSLLPWLTVHENVCLAVEQVHPEWSRAKQREEAQKYVEKVNLGPARDKFPRQLSGGMRQRVSVARALAMDPEVLLLDEPLGALDALTRSMLQEEIGRICQESKKTVLLITNDVDEGVLLADRVIPLLGGPGATLGEPVDVDLARPRNRKALDHDPRFTRLRTSVYSQLRAAKQLAQTKDAIVAPIVDPSLDLAVEVRA